MNPEQPRNPLHGVKLEQIVTDLVDTFGFEVLAQQVNLNCFKANPSVKSSLKFLRKTPWAREKVELLYVYAIVRGKPLKSQAEFKAKAKPTKPSSKNTQANGENKGAKVNASIWNS